MSEDNQKQPNTASPLLFQNCVVNVYTGPVNNFDDGLDEVCDNPNCPEHGIAAQQAKAQGSPVAKPGDVIHTPAFFQPLALAIAVDKRLVETKTFDWKNISTNDLLDKAEASLIRLRAMLKNDNTLKTVRDTGVDAVTAIMLALDNLNVLDMRNG